MGYLRNEDKWHDELEGILQADSVPAPGRHWLYPAHLNESRDFRGHPGEPKSALKKPRNLYGVGSNHREPTVGNVCHCSLSDF